MDLYLLICRSRRGLLPIEENLRVGTRGPDYVARSPRFSSGTTLRPCTPTHVSCCFLKYVFPPLIFRERRERTREIETSMRE